MKTITDHSKSVLNGYHPREYTLRRKTVSAREQIPTALQTDAGTMIKEVNREHTSMALTKGHQQSCETTLPQVQLNCLQNTARTRTERGEEPDKETD